MRREWGLGSRACLTSRGSFALRCAQLSIGLNALRTTQRPPERSSLAGARTALRWCGGAVVRRRNERAEP